MQRIKHRINKKSSPKNYPVAQIIHLGLTVLYFIISEVENDMNTHISVTLSIISLLS